MVLDLLENKLRLKARSKARGIQLETSVGPNPAEIEKSWVASPPSLVGPPPFPLIPHGLPRVNTVLPREATAAFLKRDQRTWPFRRRPTPLVPNLPDWAFCLRGLQIFQSTDRPMDTSSFWVGGSAPHTPHLRLRPGGLRPPRTPPLAHPR